MHKGTALRIQKHKHPQPKALNVLVTVFFQKRAGRSVRYDRRVRNAEAAGSNPARSTIILVLKCIPFLVIFFFLLVRWWQSAPYSSSSSGLWGVIVFLSLRQVWVAGWFWRILQAEQYITSDSLSLREFTSVSRNKWKCDEFPLIPKSPPRRRRETGDLRED